MTQYPKPWDKLEPVCVGCNLRPHELRCYTTLDVITSGEMTPNEYVYYEEGTYNRANGHFLCDWCYITAGMPTAPDGWVAP